MKKYYAPYVDFTEFQPADVVCASATIDTDGDNSIWMDKFD